MRLSDFLLQLLIAFFGAAAGVLMARFLPGEKKTPSSSSVDISRSTFHGNVFVDGRTLNVNADNRLVIGAADLTGISRTERVENAQIRLLIDQHKEQERRHRRQLDEISRQDASTDNDDWASTVLVILGVLAAVAVAIVLLIQFRSQIILTVILISSFALAFSFSAIWYSAMRKVKLTGWVVFQVGTDVAVAIALILSLNWLYGPPLRSRPDVVSGVCPEERDHP